MTVVNQWWRNPKSQNSEAIEAIRVSHFAYSLYKKPEHELSATKNSSHHQTNHDKTMTRPFCSHLIKAVLNQHLLCQVTHPPLKASVSSITDCSHRGSGNLELQTQLQEAVLLWDKNISWCLAAGKDNASNIGIFKLKSLHFQKCLYSHYKKGDFDFFDNM